MENMGRAGGDSIPLLIARSAAAADHPVADRPVADRSGSVTMDFDLTAHETGKEVRLWIPYPVSDKDQVISSIRVSGDFAESAVYTDREHGNPILFARWNKDAASRKLTLSFSADRKEVL